MADGLWQAQDDRLDADAVFVIPGPEAVAGITRADEPVAELLARFEAEAIARVAAPPVPRARLADPGPAPAPLATSRGRPGRGALRRAVRRRPRTARTRPNPLWRLSPPATRSPSTTARVTVRPSSATVESVTLDRGRRRRARHVDTGVADPLVLRFALDARRHGVLAATRQRVAAGRARRVRRGRRRRARARPSPPARSPPSAPPLVEDPFRGRRRPPWTCPAELPRAYRAATGAAHDGVPLDLALTLAWPALAALLADAGARGAAARARPRVARGHARARRGRRAPGESGRRVGAARRARRPRRRADAAALPRPADIAARRGRRRRGRARDPRRRARDRRSRCAAATSTTSSSRSPRPATPTSSPPSRGCADARARRRRRPARARRDDRRRRRATAPRAGPRRGTVIARRRDDRDASPAHAAQPRIPVAARRSTRRSRRAGARAARAAGAARSPTAEDVAPASMEAFARVGGDRNPLHRSVLAARMAGLARPIVHGAWTAARAAAFVVDALCGGDATLLRDWRVTFLAPVALGAPLDFEATRVGVVGGRRVVQVRVRVGGDGRRARRGARRPAADRARLPRPGHPAPGPRRRRPRALARRARGVGARRRAHARARSASRCSRSSSATRASCGSPTARVAPAPRRRPVPHRVHAAGAASRSPPRSSPSCARRARVGDDVRRRRPQRRRVRGAARARRARARGGARARAPARRGDAGARPARRGRRLALPAGGRRPVGATSRRSSATTVEVVNHNAPGRQYAVAGTADAIAGSSAARQRAVRVLPGIDVPFHSSVLRGAVDEFRPHLEAVGDRPGAARRPLGAERARGRAVRAPGDDVVELLARQLASPVRWIETQRALVEPRRPLRSRSRPRTRPC